MKEKFLDVFDDVYQIIRKNQLTARFIELILWLPFLMLTSVPNINTSSFFVWIFMPYHITLTLLFVLLIIGNIREFFKFADTHREMYPGYPKKKFKHLWSASLCYHKMLWIKDHPESTREYVKIGKKQISKADRVAFSMLLANSITTALCWSLMFLIPLQLYIPKEFIRAHFWVITMAVTAFCIVYWFIIHATNNAFVTVQTIRINETRNLFSSQKNNKDS